MVLVAVIGNNHGYVTLVWSHMHMHWSSQKCLEVLIIGTNVMHNVSVHPLYHIQNHIIHNIGLLQGTVKQELNYL